jgi:hypothetical protein
MKKFITWIPFIHTLKEENQKENYGYQKKPWFYYL